MQRSRQSGYTLLVVMLALLGMGGLVAAEFVNGARDEVERERRLHNERVLAEAKQALLMYAYNYPEIAGNPRGPGRLPCPDADGPANGIGIPTTGFNDCEIGGEGMIGRLPWNAAGLDFYDARDADGQRLWYAVSANHNHWDAEIVNSSDVGTITVHNQAGQRLYDGSVEGVVAVIIAPGAPVERGGALQDRVTNPDDPEHYLDQSGAFDNAHFVNFDADNGFVTGPIEDMVNGTLLVNDQLVYITTDEIREVATKATLRAYRDALTAYDARIDAGVGNGDYYPWLYNFVVYQQDDVVNYPDLNEFPATDDFTNPTVGVGEQVTYLSPGNVGRIPSMFARYFIDSDSERIESELRLSLTMDFPVTPLVRVGFTPDYSGECPQNGIASCGPLDSVEIDFDAADDEAATYGPGNPLNNVEFDSTGVGAGYTTSLSAENPGTIMLSRDVYFWDEIGTGNGYEQCGPVADDENDCNPWLPAQVLRVMIRMPIVADPMRIELDYGAAFTTGIIDDPDAGNHAVIRATFPLNGVNLAALPLSVRYEYDHNFNASFDVQSEGTMDITDMLTDGTFEIDMRYYPELPNWIRDDEWYQNVLFAYAADYRPDVATDCTIGTDCLRLNNSPGVKDDKISVLVFGGPDAWIDANNPNLSDDLGSVFDAEHFDGDTVFDAFSPGGNDRAFVVCERTAGGSECL